MPLNFESKTLHFPKLGLHLDPSRPCPFAFVSHGHADHFARHERILCSEGTGHLLVKRYGVAPESIRTMNWEETVEIAGHQIRLYPAGHITGSAMIRIEHEGHSLLYTGDFKTRESFTAERPVFPEADILVMETTFGKPHFVFPDPAVVHAEIVSFAQAALDEKETPIFLAYSLGKAQEALAILDRAHIPVALQRNVFEMTEAVRELGIELSDPVRLEKTFPPGVAVIAPPNAVRSRLVRNFKTKRTAMLSGWALTPGAKFRYQVDAVFALSDHADFPGLIEAVARVKPSLVYTLHGSTREFAAELRARGYEAWSIYGDDQLELLGKDPVAPALPDRMIPRPGCDLRDLSELLDAVGETPSRLKKTALIAAFLKDRSDEETARVLAWLSGDGIFKLGPAMIRQALLEVTGFPLAKYQAVSANQNDLSRTARLLLEEAELSPKGYDFQKMARRFEELDLAKGSLAKTRLLAAWLGNCHPREGETLVRLLTGGLRTGAKEGIYEEAVAEAFGVDQGELRYAAMLTGDLGEAAVAAKNGTLSEIRLRPGVALKPMLAAPTATAEELLEWHREGPLWLEPKYDGIRSQLHVTEKGARLFSRDLRPLDEEFSEIIAAAEGFPSCVLDGELIAYAEGKRLTFFDLQKRLGRKKVQGDLFFGAAIPVRFVAFDCLYFEKSLIDRPLIERRTVLENLPWKDPFSLIPLARPAGDDAASLEAEFKKAMADDHEGLIAKDPASLYQPGRRGKAWRKLKGVMPTLDCVVIAAQQGHGKRAGVLSDYTFAVRDENSGELRTLGKAYTGLTDEEIEELTDHFEKTAIERLSRRVIRVEPTIVLEIAFDKIRPSKRHDSGLALRFPRIKAIRRDKSVAEIDTLRTAQKLLG